MNNPHGVSQQQTAEADVQNHREQLGPFVVAADQTRMPMVFTNAKVPGHCIVFANESFLGLTGYAREEILGTPLRRCLASNISAETLAAFEAAFDGTHEDLELPCLRKNGQIFWVSMVASPVRDDQRQVVQHFVSLFNLMKHKEDQLRSNILIDELSHRVKNNLATIQSIVRHATRDRDEGGEICRAIENRIHAIASAQEFVAHGNWRGSPLHALVRSALNPILKAPPDSTSRLIAEGPDVIIDPRDSFALSIAIHELGMNALQFGALSTSLGVVLLSWNIVSGHIQIEWRETQGPAVSIPKHRGLGSYLIGRGLPRELAGTATLDFAPEGVVCKITFPVSRDRDVA